MEAASSSYSVAFRHRDRLLTQSAAHNTSAVTPQTAQSDHNSAAQVVRPIIALVIHLPNTVGDRVMSYRLTPTGRNSSPVLWRGRERLGSRISSGFEAVIDRSDVPFSDGVRC